MKWVCPQCQEGYFLDPIDFTCQPCNLDMVTHGCSACEWVNLDLENLIDYPFTDLRCTECSEGYYMKGNTCQANSIPGCLKANPLDYHECDECEIGWSLIAGACTKCDDECVECDPTGSCTVCPIGMGYYSGGEWLPVGGECKIDNCYK